jgi:hypothetical protein
MTLESSGHGQIVTLGHVTREGGQSGLTSSQGKRMTDNLGHTNCAAG